MPTTGALDLTLDDAVALALEHNLEIAVERLNPQMFDLQIAGVRALYRPVLSSTVGQNNVTQIPTNQLVGTQAVQNDQTTFNVGGTQLLPWGGGNLTLGFNNRRQDSTSSFNTFNPQYNSTFSALFVQPLLRNFRTDATRTQLRITAINRDVSELQLRATVTNTLADVRNAYWDYVYTVDQLQVARRSLELAREAARRQPHPRRGRHAGADRRRPGRGRGRDAAPGRGAGRGPGPHRGARAEAPDRRRRRRSALAGAAPAGRSAGVRAGSRSISTARCVGRSTRASTWRSRASSCRPTICR